MNKVGIVTLNGYFNYGNRLQNYALQEVLKSYENEVETIWIEEEKPNSNNLGLIRKAMGVIKRPTNIIRKINNIRYLDKLNLERELRFKVFSEKYIKESSYNITENHLPDKYLDRYNYFITGSDQVWNPYFTNASPLYFLTFAPTNKRIAYSPSFGISDIPREHVEDYKKWLSDMSFLSVREEAGASIIKRLTGREAPVLADPTLLLNKDDWLSIAEPAADKPNDDFILTYFLGEISKDTQKLINRYRKEYNLKVINLANPKYRDFYLTDPSEFLDYINTAKLFVTDSFHGAVFSILFETPFVVTDRKGQLPSMNSRITTLLSTFGLEHRHVNKVNKNELMNLGFAHIQPILNEERAKAFEYLNTALSENKVVG